MSRRTYIDFGRNSRSVSVVRNSNDDVHEMRNNDDFSAHVREMMERFDQQIYQSFGFGQYGPSILSHLTIEDLRLAMQRVSVDRVSESTCRISVSYSVNAVRYQDVNAVGHAGDYIIIDDPHNIDRPSPDEIVASNPHLADRTTEPVEKKPQMTFQEWQQYAADTLSESRKRHRGPNEE
jgi:hypothetical protein